MVQGLPGTAGSAWDCRTRLGLRDPPGTAGPLWGGGTRLGRRDPAGHSSASLCNLVGGSGVRCSVCAGCASLAATLVPAAFRALHLRGEDGLGGAPWGNTCQGEEDEQHLIWSFIRGRLEQGKVWQSLGGDEEVRSALEQNLLLSAPTTSGGGCPAGPWRCCAGCGLVMTWLGARGGSWRLPGLLPFSGEERGFSA